MLCVCVCVYVRTLHVCSCKSDGCAVLCRACCCAVGGSEMAEALVQDVIKLLVSARVCKGWELWRLWGRAYGPAQHSACGVGCKAVPHSAPATCSRYTYVVCINRTVCI